jgi:glucokinase
MALSLVADIGGTNTRVALAEGARVDAGRIRRYRNRDFAGIDGVLAAYLAAEGVAGVGGACVAAAGPVRDGAVTMTNLVDERGAAWVIDPGRVTRATGAAQVAVLNDLQAQGQALGHLAAGRLRTLIDGPCQTGATKLVVGLGTGVNAAPVHETAAGRIVPPSECGHMNMPARGTEGARLQAFVEGLLAARGEVAHAGVEEVLSGRGLANLAAFAAPGAGVPPLPDSAAVLAALAADDPVAAEAARLYTYILGQMLADLALIHLPYGGIFLIGGMSRALAPAFARFGLTAAFRENRRVPLLTTDFAVSVVEDDYAALTGCAAFLAGQSG